MNKEGIPEGELKLYENYIEFLKYSCNELSKVLNSKLDEFHRLKNTFPSSRQKPAPFIMDSAISWVGEIMSSILKSTTTKQLAYTKFKEGLNNEIDMTLKIETQLESNNYNIH